MVHAKKTKSITKKKLEESAESPGEASEIIEKLKQNASSEAKKKSLYKKRTKSTE